MRQPTLALILCLFGSAIPGFSQLFSVGVKAGVPLLDSPTATYPGVISDPPRWLIGPTAEIHLPFRFSVEVDALYRRQKLTVNPRSTFVAPYNESFGDWELPFLAKYDLTGGPLRPFVDAGVAYRHISGSYVTNASSAGFALGGGVAFKLLFLRFSPEFRYTRWVNQTGLDNPLATAPQNQADFLVGFTF